LVAREEAHDVRDHEDRVARGIRRHDRRRTLEIEGDGLLEQHVPAGAERANGELGMGGRGRADGDDADFGVGEHVVELGHDLRDGSEREGGAGAAGADVADAVAEPEPRPCLGMGAAHVPRTDDRDAVHQRRASLMTAGSKR
jgi:hypothetical protein